MTEAIAVVLIGVVLLFVAAVVIGGLLVIAAVLAVPLAGLAMIAGGLVGFVQALFGKKN